MTRFALALALVACTSKPAPSTPPAPQTPTAPPPAATLAKGPIGLGCFAYSPSERAAACITGRYEPDNNGKMQVEFIHGAEGLVPVLDAEVTPELSASVDPLLAKGGYASLPEGSKLEIDKPLHGVRWTVNDKRDRLTATCGGHDKELFAVDGKELKVKLTSVADVLLLEISVRLDDRPGGVMQVLLVDAKTCEQLRTAR